MADDTGLGDGQGLDAGPDLAPRTDLDDPDAIRRQLSSGRRRWIVVVLAALVVVAGFIVVQFLRDATLFFRNVDEAVAEREELGDRRFRLQGRVIPATVDSSSGVVTFEVIHDCEVAGVRHLTDPPELFDNPWIPVVLEGHWEPRPVQLIDGPDDHVFVSDRMLVKHTNEYSSDNRDRIDSNLPEDFFEGCAISRSDVGLGG